MSKSKALEGKSAEEIVAVRYPGQLPDYQRLKSQSLLRRE